MLLSSFVFFSRSLFSAALGSMQVIHILEGVGSLGACNALVGCGLRHFLLKLLTKKCEKMTHFRWVVTDFRLPNRNDCSFSKTDFWLDIGDGWAFQKYQPEDCATKTEGGIVADRMYTLVKMCHTALTFTTTTRHLASVNAAVYTRRHHTLRRPIIALPSRRCSPLV